MLKHGQFPVEVVAMMKRPDDDVDNDDEWKATILDVVERKLTVVVSTKWGFHIWYRQQRHWSTVATSGCVIEC